jgi:succinate dehydrogenase/fumarate reductase flavoprotein subunit
VGKVEAENLYLTALMVASSAPRREESRGVHYREDFPTEDDHNWQRNIIIVKGENGSPQLKEEPPINHL